MIATLAFNELRYVYQVIELIHQQFFLLNFLHSSLVLQLFFVLFLKIIFFFNSFTSFILVYFPRQVVSDDANIAIFVTCSTIKPTKTPYRKFNYSTDFNNNRINVVLVLQFSKSGIHSFVRVFKFSGSLLNSSSKMC